MSAFRVINGDCLDCLDNIGDESIHLILTSPPYANQRKATYGGIDPEKYVEWFLPRSEKFFRVLHPNGSFILNIKEHAENHERHTYVYELVIALRTQGWLWLDEFVWHKKNVMPTGNSRRLTNAWEPLYHFAKSKKPAFYVDAVRQPLAKSSMKRYQNITKKDKSNIESSTGSGFKRNWESILSSAIDQTALPRNVLHLANSTYERYHPASFPRSIPEFFIKLLTLPGDVVLDPFAGGGTTLLAAYEMDRKAIGIEIVEEYIDIIHKRKSALPVRLPGLM